MTAMMLKLSEQSRNRIQDGLKKYTRIVHQARLRGMVERDTGDIVKAILGDMLGYDPFFEVTSEVSARGPHADYALLIDQQVRCLFVVKGINTEPNAAHLIRLSGVNAPSYVDWVVLTNADMWACYRLGIGPDRHPHLVFRLMLSDAHTLEEKTALFTLLSKEGMMQNALAHYWERHHALNPARIASLLLSEETLQLLRRELQRTANYRVDRQTLLELLTQEVLKPDVLAIPSADEQHLTEPHCFAYVSNINDRSSWRLPYRNNDGSPNPELLLRSAAILAANVRGLQIPGDDLPLVKERLRKAYLEIGVAMEDIPPSIRR